MNHQFAGMLNGPLGAFQGIAIDPTIYNATPQQKADYYNQLIAQGNTDADIRAAFGGISANDPSWLYLLQLAGAATLNAQKAQDIGDFAGWVQDPKNMGEFLTQGSDNLAVSVDILKQWIVSTLTAHNVTAADLSSATGMSLDNLYQRASNALSLAYNALPATTMPIVIGAPVPDITPVSDPVPKSNVVDPGIPVQNAGDVTTPQQKAALYNSLIEAGNSDAQIYAMYGQNSSASDWAYLKQIAESLKNGAASTVKAAGESGLLTPQNLAIGALALLFLLRR